MQFSTNATITLEDTEPTQPLFFADATKEKKKKGCCFVLCVVYLRFLRTRAATVTATMMIMAAAAITYMSVDGPA